MTRRLLGATWPSSCTAEARKEFDQAVLGAYEQALTQNQKQEPPAEKEPEQAQTMTL
jgi:stage V sporulation protein G